MSGPIVRKYGFPNFEEIFGKRELQHGVDEPEAKAPAAPERAAEDARAAEPKEGKGGKAKP